MSFLNLHGLPAKLPAASLLEAIRQGESALVEFKGSFQKEVIETLTAFANTPGGAVLMGVSDAGAIVGVTVQAETVQGWINQCKQITSPRIIPDIELVQIQNKTVAMVTTNDEALWRAMWAYKDHGKSYEAVYERQHPPGFRWLHESFGTNWRMLEMQAVIGSIQLRRMQDWTAKRTANAQSILAACRQHTAVRVPSFSCNASSCDAACASRNGCDHAYYKCYVYVQPKQLATGWSRDRIVQAISDEGVPCYQGSCSEVYLEKAFDGTGWRPTERLPNARELGETSIMFLVHPTLTQAEIDLTCKVIRKVLSEASAKSLV